MGARLSVSPTTRWRWIAMCKLSLGSRSVFFLVWVIVGEVIHEAQLSAHLGQAPASSDRAAHCKQR